MRALLWIAVLLMGLWSGYWFVGKSAVEEAVQRFIDNAKAQGLTIEDEGRTVAGFPNRFDLTISAPKLYDGQSGWGWQADFLQIFSLSYKPWHLIAAFAPEQELTTPFQRIKVSSTKLQASLVAKPNAALDLQRTNVIGTGLAFASEQGWQIGLEELRFATRLDETRRDTHEIGLDLMSLVPDPALAARVPDLPATIDRLRLDAFVGLSGPINRYLSQGSPRLTSIILREASVNWGALSIFSKGDLQVIDGYPQGQIDVRMQGWRELVSLLVSMGAIKPEVAPTVERMLETLAVQSGDPETLTMPLTFSGGQMRLGPLPLGPAPRLN